MTGAFLRVKRDGKWENIEVEFLTNEERTEKFKDMESLEIIGFFSLVCNKLASLDPLLKGLEEDGIIVWGEE